MTNASTTRHSTLYAAGSRACSFALRSVHETKDNLILICIGLLEAIDRLQERLRLPSSLVKDTKRKLSKMVDRSLTRPLASSMCSKLKQAGTVGDAIAESDIWGAAKPDEVKGLVHWLLAVTTSVNRLVIAGSLSMCRGMLILIMNFPGLSTACSLLNRIFQLVDNTLGLTANDGFESSPLSRGHHRHSRRQLQLESYIGDPSLTAVVLEYREKECMMPMDIKSIQDVMHFQIPLRSFEATVRLPPDNVQLHQRRAERAASGVDALSPSSLASAYVSSSSPRSVPVSPIARKRAQLAFSSFSDDVLYKVRDRLRHLHVAPPAGEHEIRVPHFNMQDCNEEIYLSCGEHCATKVGPGMYRSVRATVPIPKNRYVYFEMTLNQPKSPFRMPGRPSRSMLESSRNRAPAGSGAAQAVGNDGPSACIGLSTRAMPLNALVGVSKCSIGFYSAGHVLIGSEHRGFESVDLGFGYEATVGVLVKMVDRADLPVRESSESLSRMARRGFAVRNGQQTVAAATNYSTFALVRFSVNGVALRDRARHVLVFALPLPSASELFPTLTLRSQDVQVLGRFSVADITALNMEDFELPPMMSGGNDDDRSSSCSSSDIWCLDGLRLELPCRQ